MKKSVYSLVLFDDVIKAIDDLAYQINTSRSNLINQILAEYVSYKTPESLIKDIFNSMMNIMDSHFQIQGQVSDTMLSFRSPLRFKYKPTIRYRVELLKDTNNHELGNLSVSFRTQSIQLMQLFGGFLEIWCNLERKYFQDYFPSGIEYDYTDGRFVRKLKASESLEKSSPEEIGKAIGDYIRLLDSEIKIYFAEIDDMSMGIIKMEKLLSDSIKNNLKII